MSPRFNYMHYIDDMITNQDHVNHVTDHTNHVTDHTNYVTDHTNHATDHTNHATDHTNSATDHTNHATDHTSYTKSIRDHTTSNHYINYTRTTISKLTSSKMVISQGIKLKWISMRMNR